MPKSVPRCGPQETHMICSQTSLRLIKPLIAIAALLFAGLATAETVAPNAAKPILTISGKIEAGDAGVQFDRAALEALGMVAFETKTPWYDHPVKFEGI